MTRAAVDAHNSVDHQRGATIEDRADVEQSSRDGKWGEVMR